METVEPSDCSPNDCAGGGASDCSPNDCAGGGASDCSPNDCAGGGASDLGRSESAEDAVVQSASVRAHRAHRAYRRQLAAIKTVLGLRKVCETLAGRLDLPDFISLRLGAPWIALRARDFVAGRPARLVELLLGLGPPTIRRCLLAELLADAAAGIARPVVDFRLLARAIDWISLCEFRMPAPRRRAYRHAIERLARYGGLDDRAGRVGRDDRDDRDDFADRDDRDNDDNFPDPESSSWSSSEVSTDSDDYGDCTESSAGTFPRARAPLERFVGTLVLDLEQRAAGGRLADFLARACFPRELCLPGDRRQSVADAARLRRGQKHGSSKPPADAENNALWRPEPAMVEYCAKYCARADCFYAFALAVGAGAADAIAVLAARGLNVSRAARATRALFVAVKSNNAHMLATLVRFMPLRDLFELPALDTTSEVAKILRSVGGCDVSYVRMSPAAEVLLVDAVCANNIAAIEFLVPQLIAYVRSWPRPRAQLAHLGEVGLKMVEAFRRELRPPQSLPPVVWDLCRCAPNLFERLAETAFYRADAYLLEAVLASGDVSPARLCMCAHEYGLGSHAVAKTFERVLADIYADSRAAEFFAAEFAAAPADFRGDVDVARAGDICARVFENFVASDRVFSVAAAVGGRKLLNFCAQARGALDAGTAGAGIVIAAANKNYAALTHFDALGLLAPCWRGDSRVLALALEVASEEVCRALAAAGCTRKAALEAAAGRPWEEKIRYVHWAGSQHVESATR